MSTLDEAIADWLARQPTRVSTSGTGKKRASGRRSWRSSADSQMAEALRTLDRLLSAIRNARSSVEVNDGAVMAGEYARLVSKAVFEVAGLRESEGRRLDRPIPYRCLPMRFKYLFDDLAVRTLGPHTTFTLNVSVEKAAAAAAHPDGVVDYHRQRVRQELHRTFGRPIPLAFVLEEHKPTERSPGQRPHLHGIVAVGIADAVRLKHALVTAGGPYHGQKWFRDHHAVDLKPPHNLFGWAAYASKSLFDEDAGNTCVGLAASQDVTRAAKMLYATYCSAVRAARGGVRPVS